MLKSLWLTIMGWLRITAAKNTNLEYAGKEQIHQTRQDIEKLRTQRNQIAAKGVGVERRLKQAQLDTAKAKEAVQHWHTVGDSVKKQEAYDLYVKNAKETDVQQLSLAEYTRQVADLDNKIKELENVIDAAERKIGSAAATQSHARAANKAEDIHDRFNDGGDLALATQLAEESSDMASVRSNTRKSKETPDVFSYQQQSNVVSLDELLGDMPKPAASSALGTDSRGSSHNHHDESSSTQSTSSASSSSSGNSSASSSDSISSSSSND